MPEDDEANREGENQGGDGVDFRGDAAPETAPDFERQSVVPPDQEKGDGDLVHGEREDEQGGGMAEKNGEEAELSAREDGEHQQGEAGDDAGENQRKKNKAAEEGFSVEIGAIKGERGQQAEGQRERHAACSHHQAINDGIPDRGIGEKPAVPIEREMAGRETADAITIEGIEDEDDDGQINENKNERGINFEERSTAICGVAIHLNDQRFSSRSLRKSKEMVRMRMPTEIAAPRGQSKAAPKRLCTTLAIIVPEAPPTRSGARKSPRERTKAKVDPAPRSCEASTSGRGMCSRAA